MRKLKWWQWVLVVFFGLSVVGTIVASPDKRAKAPFPSAAPSATLENAKPKFDLISGDAIYAMTFDGAADPQSLPDLAREQCDKKSFCKVLGWTEPKYAARGFPMTDREVSAEAFSYSLNRATGFEQAQWDCKRWPQKTRDECL